MARVAIRTLPGTLKNYCINGNFDFWQRGLSFSIATGGAYFCDRFKYGRDGSGDTGTVSRQAFSVGQTAVPGNPTYFLRHDQTVAGTGTTTRALEHRIEDVSTFSGGTMTVSFWAKADTSRTISANVVQNFGSGGSSLVSVSSQSINLTTGWQKFSLTYTIPSVSSKTVGANNFISIQWFLPLNTIHTIDMAQVMVNDGSAATNFVLAGNSLTGELALCQRYYEKSYNVATPPGSNTSVGAFIKATSGDSGGSHYFSIDYKVTKRTASHTALTYDPSGTSNSSSAFANNTAQSGVVFSGNPTTNIDTVSESGFFARAFSYAAYGNGRVVGQWSADAEL